MGRKPKTVNEIRKIAIGLLDNRSSDNDGMLIKRDQKVTMIDIFGTEQKTVVAYFVSDLMAKGFNNQQIIVAIENKFGLTWSVRQVNVVKELLHKMWRCEMAHSMNDHIAREVATIDTQIKETWEAWEFSKRGIKNTKKRNTDSKSEAPEMDFTVEEIITDETTSAGEVKFLQHLNDLGKEKRKLLGLYAPEKKNDDSVKTAVQFNIVGEGAGGEITSMMASIMKGAGAMQQPVQQQQAEDIPYEQADTRSNFDDKESFIESMYREVLGDEL